MINCIVLKTLKETDDGYTVLLKVGNSTRVYFGNIPDFPNGTNCNFEFNGSRIIDYSCNIYSERNLKIFQNKNIDIDTFEKKMKLQKEKGFKWNEMDNIENPYKAYEFPVADKLAYQLGMSADSKERIEKMTKYAREKVRMKNIEIASLENMMGAYASIEKESPYDELPFQDKMQIIFNDEDYYISDNMFVDSEIEMANKFIDSNINSRKHSDYFSISREEIDLFLANNHTLDEKQRDAVYELNNNQISAICGNAGTGKTFTIKTILDCYASHRGKENILCLAPTGKASRRITEESGYPAYTIHSALKMTPMLDRCGYSQQNPLPYDLIIVDESSMIATMLMYYLLQACSYTTKLIFVGDDKQLPPVGCGRPFEKFLHTCSVVRLDRIFRQGSDSGILRNSYNVLGNKDLEEYDDFHIKNITMKDIDEIVKGTSEDIQLIVPFNKLRRRINEIVQNNDTNEKFVVGDKVIALKNTDDYCNGDVGYIKKINKMDMLIEMKDTGKTIRVKHTCYHHFDLAYALTVHKMQGSEADNIAIFLPKESTPFITEEMLYTAITRAKKSVQIYYYQ